MRLKTASRQSSNSYLVTALLPASGDSPQYRIRNTFENFDRMATQDDLEFVKAPRVSESAALLEKSFGVHVEAGRRSVERPSLDNAQGSAASPRPALDTQRQ